MKRILNSLLGIALVFYFSFGFSQQSFINSSGHTLTNTNATTRTHTVNIPVSGVASGDILR